MIYFTIHFIDIFTYLEDHPVAATSDNNKREMGEGKRESGAAPHTSGVKKRSEEGFSHFLFSFFLYTPSQYLIHPLTMKGYTKT